MRLAYLLAAVALPALVLGLGAWVVGATSGRSVTFPASIGEVAAPALLIGAPFLAFGLGPRGRGERASSAFRWAPLLAGVAFVVAVWTCVSWIEGTRLRDASAGGANSGAGLIVLATSLLTLWLMGAVERWTTRRARPR